MATTRGAGGARVAASLVCAAAIHLAVLAPAASAAEAIPAPGSKAPHVTLEPIPGGGTKRITLSARAAERLGIRFGKVTEGAVPHTQIVGGVVVPPAIPIAKGGSGGAFGGFAPVPAQPGVTRNANPDTVRAGTPDGQADGAAQRAGGDVWVRLSLSLAEWERVAVDKPARLVALAGRAPFPGDLTARPSGLPPVEDPRRGMLWVYYVVPGGNQGLAPDSRVRVELEQTGSGKQERIVPYAAVYYDNKGDAWVYSSLAPLTFERHRVAVERIAGDQAILSEGPPVGTSVVVVGASLLYGAEVLGR